MTNEEIKQHVLKFTEQNLSKDLNFEKLTTLQRETNSLLEQNNLDELKDFFIKNNGYYSNKDDIISYLDLVSFEDKKEAEDSRFITPVIPDYMISVGKTRFSEASFSFMKLDEPYSWDSLKVLSHMISTDFYEKDDVFRAPFFISPEKKIKGMVSILINKNKVMSHLGKVYTKNTKEGVEHHLVLFGEQHAFHKVPKFINSHGFFVYKFLSDDHKEYFVLSEDRMFPERGVAVGNVVMLNDSLRVGTTGSMSVGKEVILLHHFEPEINKISDADYENLRDGFDGREDFYSAFFREYRYPEWFMRLVLACVFSGKKDGYGVSLSVCGPPGTAKTSLLELLNSQFPELKGVFYAAGGTIKGLIPSFAEFTPKEGYFATCQRLSYVDEFLKLVSVRAGQSKNDIGDQTKKLVDVLEQRRVTYSSGAGSVDIHPRARVFMSSNFPTGCPDLMSVAETVDNTFMSRMLWLVQDEDFVEFIEDGKISFVNRSSRDYPSDKRFRVLFDYLTEKNLSFDAGFVKKVIEDVKVPDALDQIFRARAVHHLVCLVDGVAKINSLIEKRAEIVVTQDDVEEGIDLFLRCVQSWDKTFRICDRPVKQRVKYLKPRDVEVYALIEDSPGITKDEVERVTKRNEAYRLKKLEKIDLVVLLDNRYYPHWHFKAKESREELVEFADLQEEVSG